MKTRRNLAFTLVELLVAVGISSIVGMIIYGVASEELAAFARNVSINRSYSNGRQSIDQVAISMQSAGHVPVLIDATGTDISPAPALNVPSAGIRFWRNTTSSAYPISSVVALTSTSITLSLSDPTTSPATPLAAPVVGDMITIPVLCFQARVTSVSGGVGTATVSFSGTVVSNTSPTLTAANLVIATTNGANSYTGKMTCLNWTSTAFIAVNNQLRYFPKFISGTTSVSTPTNYHVLTYLTASLGTAATPLPFSLGPTPSINVDLYAEAPDYNNRTTIAGTTNGFVGLNTANTYTYLQTALSTRNSAIIRNP